MKTTQQTFRTACGLMLVALCAAGAGMDPASSSVVLNPPWTGESYVDCPIGRHDRVLYEGDPASGTLTVDYTHVPFSLFQTTLILREDLRLDNAGDYIEVRVAVQEGAPGEVDETPALTSGADLPVMDALQDARVQFLAVKSGRRRKGDQNGQCQRRFDRLVRHDSLPPF